MYTILCDDLSYYALHTCDVFSNLLYIVLVILCDINDVHMPNGNVIVLSQLRKDCWVSIHHLREDLSNSSDTNKVVMCDVQLLPIKGIWH